MKWLQHLFLSLAILSVSPKEVTATFINSQRGTTTANPQQKQQKPLIINTAADAAIALNSIAFMNSLCRRKNTADVRTFTQPITASSSSMVVDPNKHDVAAAESCIDKKQSASRDNDDDDTLPLWTLLNVFFRNDKQQQHCPQEKLPSSETTTNHHHNNNNNNKLHTQPTTTTTTHETIAEYTGQLWFLPKSKSQIQFRETIRIISLGLDGGTSTIECLTEYYKGKGGKGGGEWVDCSRILCHFTSLDDLDYDEVRRGAGAAVDTNDDDGGDTTNDASLLQSKVKMTLDCEILVWLPLPSVASRAVRNKISSVFEEAVVEFLWS